MSTAKEPNLVQPAAPLPAKTQVEDFGDGDSACEITEIKYKETETEKVTSPVEAFVKEPNINVEEKPTPAVEAQNLVAMVPETEEEGAKAKELVTLVASGNEGAKATERKKLVAKRKRRALKCCNIDCTVTSYSGTMVHASTWDAAFCSVPEGKPGVLWICKKCKESSDECFEEALRLGKEGKAMLEAASKFKKPQAVDLDSDEEKDPAEAEDETDPDDELVAVDMDAVADLVKSIGTELNLDKQMDLSLELVKKKIAETKEEMAEYEAEWEEVQTKLDDLHARIYNPWNPIYKELASVEIDMDGSVYPHCEWQEEACALPPTPPRLQNPVASKSMASHSMAAMNDVAISCTDDDPLAVELETSEFPQCQRHPHERNKLANCERKVDEKQESLTGIIPPFVFPPNVKDPHKLCPESL